MEVFLIWFIKTVVTLFWILDICNMPFMEIFDTTYPLNGMFWFLFFALCGGGISITSKDKNRTQEGIDNDEQM